MDENVGASIITSRLERRQVAKINNAIRRSLLLSDVIVKVGPKFLKSELEFHCY